MNTVKSKASYKSDGVVKLHQIPTISKNGQKQTNIHMMQNVLLIWLDNNINENNNDCKNTIAQLRHSINNIKTFTNRDQCIEFLDSVEQEKACIIISGSLGQRIVPLIHDMFQVDSIFIFCGNKQYHEQWAKDWAKIKGVFTEIAPICEALKQAVQYCEHNALSISFMATNDDVNNAHLNRLDCSFMYTQILKEILLTVPFEQEQFKEFIHYCKEQFVGNERELQYIKELKRQYEHKTPIWWYTRESFLYPMLNRALRVMNTDIIVQMGFFIVDLHRHIARLHSQQFDDHHPHVTFTVYRGQGLSKVDFNQLMTTKGGLMAFNNFLSTSKDRTVSLNFARRTLTNPDTMGILFAMTIDSSQSTTPFASTTKISQFNGEDEVLFSMHSVFRIQDIQRIDDNNRLYQVDLTLSNDNDKDLRMLTERIREEIPGKGWYRLGVLLRKMGNFDKAQEIFQVLLNRATDESEKASIYHQLGSIDLHRKQYSQAIKLFEISLELKQRTLVTYDLSLAHSYNNIGVAYYNMDDYPKALFNYQKALEIKQQLLSPNHPDLGASFNNIGVACESMGDYSNAFLNYKQAYEINQQAFPPNHPNVGTSYHNIGNLCESMGEYSKALYNHERALEIRQQSLPPNHPDLGASYNSIGAVYDNMHDYPKALTNYKKGLEIRQQFLPPNHLDLGMSYHNIGNMYYNIGDHSKALSNYEKVLEIRQQLLSPNHPDLAITYNNIGIVHEKMADYYKAHSFYERALKIAQRSLPANHPHLKLYKENVEDIKKKL